MSPRDWRNTRVLVLRWDTMLPAVRYNDLMQNGEAYGHAGSKHALAPRRPSWTW